MRFATLVVLLLLSGAVAGCTSKPEAVDNTVTVKPGGFHELNFHLDQGKRVEWSWTTAKGLPLYFNVHSHPDGQLQEHVVRTAGSDQGAFTAERGGVYSLLWENKRSTNVEVTFQTRIYGEVVA